MSSQSKTTPPTAESDAPVDAAVDPFAELEADWGMWLAVIFGHLLHAPLAPHHIDFWSWVWSIEPGVAPPPFIGIWPRGGGKSASAELAVVSLGCRGIRRYGLYVSGSQDRADEHVQNIADLLESDAVATWYPSMSDRAVTKFGQWRGWRRNRLHTKSGFVLDALGLDVVSRGLKVSDQRPDMLVFDDIDDHEDSDKTVQAKMDALTRRILPATVAHAAILGIQNLIHRNSVFSQLADNRARFLANRIVSGPIPAIEDMTYETRTEADGRFREVITGGTPTWEGLTIAKCQEEIDKEGMSVFKVELQHETPDQTGGMYDDVTFRRAHPLGCDCGDPTDHVPELDKVVCWVDPAVTDTDQADSQAIQIDGIARDRIMYRLWSWEKRTSPQEAIRMALTKALEYGAIYVGIETDQGGDTWKSVFREARASLGPRYSHLQLRQAKAGAGHGSKVHRSSQMLSDYERGQIVHVQGTHHILEAALLRFPRVKPYDLVDACYYGWWDLRRLSRPATATSAASERIGQIAAASSMSQRPRMSVVPLPRDRFRP